MKWIKVTDRLPEFEKDVFVSGEGRVEKAFLEAYRVTRAGIVYEWVQSNKIDRIWIEVTHWAIPEPPKD